MDYHIDLLPDNIYHVFSRAVGSEKLFLSDENYRFFLSKFNAYIFPIADVYAWALLPNHFHFMIRIKEQKQVEDYYFHLKNASLKSENTSAFIMQCFSNFLNSYTKSFNKIHRRKGALFMDYLRRVTVSNESQIGATAFYIHKNPVHHGYCTLPEHWKWSSYNAYLFKKPTQRGPIELLDWFGGLTAFKKYHEQPIYLKSAVIIE